MSNSITPSSVMPVVTATVQHTHTLATRTDAFKTVAELAAGIFELIVILAKEVPVALTNFAIGLTHTIGMLTVMSLVKRVNSFVCPNDKGQMLWERETVTEGISNVIGTVGLALFNIASFARYLNSAGVIALGKIAAPLGAVGGVGLGVGASLDIIDQANKLAELPSKRMDLIRLKEFHTIKPEANAKMAAVDPAQAYAIGRAEDLKSKLKNMGAGKEYSQMVSRYNKWSQFVNLPDDQRAELWKKYNISKVEKIEIKLVNHDNAHKRTIATLIFDITVVALVVLSFVLPAVVPVSVQLSVIILGIANSVLELSTNVLEFCITDRAIKHVAVPVYVPHAPRT